MPETPIDTGISTCHSEDMKSYLNASQFARIVGKDPKTIIRWIEKGWIPNTKRLGREYQIPTSEILIYQQSKVYPPRQ